MKREILFRGKIVDNDEVDGWVYGDDMINISSGFLVFIIDETGTEPIFYEVDSKTVGQFTGVYDKNGKPIFEGDIVHCYGGERCSGYYEVDDQVVVKDITDGVCKCLGAVEFLEVIGNIYDNPELMEGDEKNETD